MLMEFVIFMAFSIQFSAPENPSMHPVLVPGVIVFTPFKRMHGPGLTQ